MIKVSINNKIEQFDINTNILTALEKLGYSNDTMLGVAVNQHFISKDNWAEKILEDKDQVDILKPVSGG